MSAKQINQLHAFFYFLLFVLLFGSAGFLIVHLVSGFDSSWNVYKNVTLVIILFFIWIEVLQLFYSDVVKRKYPHYNNELITVLIPCYNEKPELLRQSIESIINADGKKDIIVIDDGSKKETRGELKRLETEYGVAVIYFPKNMGKRHALYTAIQSFCSTIDSASKKRPFIVCTDSDTLILKDSLIRLVEPLKISKIGACTGEVLALNEKENWITRMVGAYYWHAFNIYRKANSTIGMVTCCSGAMSAYKTDVIIKIMPAFINQTFLGEACTYSEDRHLTNLVMKDGYDVVYVPEAKSYTDVPETIKGFLRQQLRWKRGYIRECTFSLAFSWRVRKWFFIKTFFLDLNYIFYSFGIHILFLGIAITKPTFFFTVILPSWLMFAFMRNALLIFRAKDKILGLIIFTFFHEFVLYWQNIYALFTVRNKSWITRG